MKTIAVPQQLLAIQQTIVVAMLLIAASHSLSTLTKLSRNAIMSRGGVGVLQLQQRQASRSRDYNLSLQSQPNNVALKMSSEAASSPVTSTSSSPEEEKEKKAPLRKRVLSGVQPTGALHLGNYLGAIRQWVTFQEESISKGDENFFCVVDLHAITMPHDPDELRESTLSSAALYLAAGIDPSKSRVFVQSHVSAHTELTWLLNCMTPMNWLERMIQYKEKSRKNSDNKDNVGVGLFSYPILMAADILLYQATHVPVGEDQRQHLELARDIVRRFHDMYCKGNKFKKRCKAAQIPSRLPFTEPEAMILSQSGSARIMSLTDGTNKMSKSDENDLSRINILDPPALIRTKIKKCKTDVCQGIEWDNPDRPESTNLLNIYYAVLPQNQKTKEEIQEEVKDLTWGQFKPLLADAIIHHLEPIQKKYAELRDDPDYLDSVLRDGAIAADVIASRTLDSAKVAMGFSRRVV